MDEALRREHDAATNGATPLPTTAVPAVDTSPRVEYRDNGRSKRLAGIITADLGVGGVALGVVFALLSKSAGDSAYRPANGIYDPAADDQQKSYRAADIVCFVVGGAMVRRGHDRVDDRPEAAARAGCRRGDKVTRWLGLLLVVASGCAALPDDGALLCNPDPTRAPVRMASSARSMAAAIEPVTRQPTSARAAPTWRRRRARRRRPVPPTRRSARSKSAHHARRRACRPTARCTTRRRRCAAQRADACSAS